MEGPKEGATGKIVNAWEPESAPVNGVPGVRYICDSQSRLILNVPLDLDEDGEDDCTNAKQKVQVYAGLYKKDRDRNSTTKGPFVAVSSLHYVLTSDFGDPVQGENKKADWSRQIADKLTEVFPSADTYAIAGDFNAQRCPKSEEPRDPLTGQELDPTVKERSICRNPDTEKPFWKALTSEKGYTESVYQMSGALPTGSDATLTAQYADGVFPGTDDVFSRERRIDHIFVKIATGSPRRLEAASYDLSCGYYLAKGIKGNCDEFDSAPIANYPYPSGCECVHRIPKNRDRYSDHRLVWAFLKPMV
jgi:hypothetical protein